MIEHHQRVFRQSRYIIRFSTVARYWTKSGSIMEQCISYL